MAEAIYLELGARIRRLREELRLTQAELSERVGLSRPSIANIESGRQAILLHQFLALAEALGSPPARLLPSATPHSEEQESRTDLPEDVLKFVRAVEGTPRTGRRR